jgi:hypothetical protein
MTIARDRHWATLDDIVNIKFRAIGYVLVAQFSFVPGKILYWSRHSSSIRAP